jgi:hypothetical protein
MNEEQCWAILPARGRGPVANTASPAQAGGLDARALQSRSPRPVGRRWRGWRRLTCGSDTVRSTAQALGGGNATVGQILQGKGSLERPVVDEVAGSSRFNGVSQWRRDPEDGYNTSEGLRLLGEKKGMSYDPNCKGDARLWTSPRAGGQWGHGFKSSSPGGVPAAGGGH